MSTGFDNKKGSYKSKNLGTKGGNRTLTPEGTRF